MIRSKSLIRILIIIFVFTTFFLNISCKEQNNMPVEGEPALDFTLLDLNNNEVTLSDFFVGAIVLNFWSTWCPACVREIPYFIGFYNEYKDKNIQFIGVSVDENKSDLIQFVKAMDINYIILIDKTIDNASKIYNIGYLPTTFLINTDGIITKIIIGGLPKEKLRNEIEKVLE